MQIALGTTQNGTDKLKLNYDYGAANNNGNILSQQITVPTTGNAAGFYGNSNFIYDALNRVTVRIYSDSTPTVSYACDDGSVAFQKDA